MTLMPRPLRSDARRPLPRRNPYEKFRDRELTLNDYLAIDRTILSNERTALAYGRTALAMLVIGGSAIKFFTQWYMWAIGGVFIAAAVVVAVIGARRYRSTARSLAVALERQTGDPGHPLRETAESRAKAEAAKEEKAAREAKDEKEAKEATETPDEPGSASESQEKRPPPESA